MSKAVIQRMHVAEDEVKSCDGVHWRTNPLSKTWVLPQMREPISLERMMTGIVGTAIQSTARGGGSFVGCSVG